ncbi:MAG: DUF5713 family protein [Bacteroidota bacterium]
MNLQNETVRDRRFLDSMFDDPYFPNPIVEKGVHILRNLCAKIESEKPGNLDALYKLTHAATDEFNDLQEEFEENGSEFETGAREAIAEEFEVIAQAYGFENADLEELIATRDW